MEKERKRNKKGREKYRKKEIYFLAFDDEGLSTTIHFTRTELTPFEGTAVNYKSENDKSGLRNLCFIESVSISP